jgi:hypothetical protein
MTDRRHLLLARRDAAVAEIERIEQRLELYPKSELRAARDSLAALVNRLDAKLIALSS